MIPFYIYYSMFGFQRVGDLAWAAGDMRARGFLLGGTAGRTTLNGEGLQHEDGHSHLLAATIPNCVAYDPTYALRGRGDHPGRPAADVRRAGGRLLLPHADERELPAPGDARGRRGGDPAGDVPAARGASGGGHAARAAARARARSCARCSRPPSCSQSDFGVAADVWSVTSFTELARDGIEAERWNLLHPTEDARGAPTSTQRSRAAAARSIAATDYMRAFADQIRPLRAGRRTRVLGTDGFGRSDYRDKLRRFFEVDRHYVAVAALKALADDGELEPAAVQKAIETYGIDPDRPAPLRV